MKLEKNKWFSSSRLLANAFVMFAISLWNVTFADQRNEKFQNFDLVATESISVDNEVMQTELRRMPDGKIIRLLYQGTRVGPAFVADEIIVGLRKDSEAELKQGPVAYKSARFIDDKTAVLELENTSYSTISSAIKAYQDSSDFRYAEKNYVLSSTLSVAGGIGATNVPNDPDSQWHLSQSNDADIDAYEAWPIISSAGNLRIAILDTGLRQSHEDILPNFNTNIQYDFAYGDAVADDVDGHGSHVAGIASAQGDNGLGGTGVAQDAELMAVKVLDNNGNGYSSDIAQGINWAVSQGAKVINLSLGGQIPRPQVIADAINNAKNSSVIVVAAAGNDSADNDNIDYYPANFSTEFDNVIAVAASTDSDSLASFSNYGLGSVNVAAPGVNIFSTYNLSDDSYALLSGTSMATPIVAGVAGLVQAHFGDAEPWEAIKRVENSVDYKGSFDSTTSSKGRVNLRRSLSLFSKKPTVSGTTGKRWASSTIQWVDDTNAPWFWSFRIGEWFYTASTDLEDIWLYSNTTQEWYYTRSSYFPGAFRDGSVWVNLENEI